MTLSLLFIIILLPCLLSLGQTIFFWFSGSERRVDSTWAFLCPLFAAPVDKTGKQIFSLPDWLFPNWRFQLQRKFGTSYSFYGIETLDFEKRLVTSLNELQVKFTRRLPSGILPLGYGEIKSDEVFELDDELGRLLVVKYGFTQNIRYIGPDPTLLRRLAERICPLSGA